MSFAALPLAYLTWDESDVSVAEFLRYQLWRQYPGEDQIKIAEITARDITFYEDARVRAGVDAEYTITQVQDVSGEEVESLPAPIVGVTVVIRSMFLHDAASPSSYVEFPINQQSMQILQDIGYVQSWSRQLPTAQIGNMQRKLLQFAHTDSWDGWAGEAFAALENLVTRQRANGAVVMARQGQDVHAFCQVDGVSRRDNGVLTTLDVRLSEVHFVEEVE